LVRTAEAGADAVPKRQPFALGSRARRTVESRTSVEHTLGNELSLWLVLPFAGMLLSIALLPLLKHEWFEHDRNKGIVSALFGVPVVAYLLIAEGHTGLEAVLRTGEEYISFIVLLAALFTISGGIYLTGNLLGKPHVNVIFLLTGAVFANLIGTTGAAMVLVRPLLRANSERTHRVHVVVFLIFIVCNLGGLLTPLGDPPLFLGFLRGVSFTWTLRLIPQWLLTVGLTLLVFYLVDRYYYRREPPTALAEDELDYVPLGLVGKVNFLFLGGVIACVLLSKPLAAIGETIHFPFVREALMVALLVMSVRFGPAQPRALNRFTWAPISEVAIIFAGIFAAMIPALAILEARGSELGLTNPAQYFWVTGVLSSFLDNAPSYLTLGSAAQGYLGVSGFEGLMGSEVIPGVGFSPASFLAAISCGAVMMGANSYIGNAPNFMVKSIAEESGIPMPHFFAYMGISAVVLLPIFGLVTLIFFL
jgi:Na+/H+ antiporter NhaD/arsenite permease-like protein